MTEEMKIDSYYEKIFTQTDLEKIKKHKNHPLLHLIKEENKLRNFSGNFSSFIKATTKIAFSGVLQKNHKYFEKLKQKLLSTNYKNSLAAISEMRAYGLLTNCFYNIQNITQTNTPTPDFKMLINNIPFYIEVTSRTISDEEIKREKDFKALMDKPSNLITEEERRNNMITIRKLNNKTIKTGIRMARPYTGEKIDEYALDQISKLTKSLQKKKKDKINYQLNQNNGINIMWLDLCDLKLGFHNFPNPISPIRSAQLTILSNPLWYALYGEENLPVFNSNTFIRFTKYPKMEHDGLFTKECNVDFVIILTFDNTLVFQNPYTTKVIPNNFYIDLLRLFRFDIGCSKLGFPINNLLEELEKEKEMLYKLDKRKIYDNY